MSKMLETTAYIEVEPRWSTYLNPITDRPNDMAAVKVTRRRPGVIGSDSVVIKVRLRMPVEAFMPLEPSVVVDIPAELVQHEISVEATDD